MSITFLKNAFKSASKATREKTRQAFVWSKNYIVKKFEQAVSQAEKKAFPKNRVIDKNSRLLIKLGAGVWVFGLVVNPTPVPVGLCLGMIFVAAARVNSEVVTRRNKLKGIEKTANENVGNDLLNAKSDPDVTDSMIKFYSYQDAYFADELGVMIPEYFNTSMRL